MNAQIAPNKMRFHTHSNTSNIQNMKQISYTLVIIILTALAVVFFMRGCGNSFQNGNSSTADLEKTLQHKNDSLSKLTAAYQKRNTSLEKSVLQLNVKIKKVDSTRISQAAKFRGLKLKTMPCDSALSAVVYHTETIIKTDSTQISMLQQKNDSLQEVNNNHKQIHVFDTQKHENDSTLITAVKAENDSLRESNKKFWKGFKWGFVVGNITGAAIGTSLLR